MNTNSNVYTIAYATVLVIIVALLLAVVANALLPRQEANVALDTKKQILASLNERNLGNAVSEQTYNEQVTEVTCEKCGLSWYEANLDGEKKYILPVKGAGLWGGIWGYIALNADRNTIYGAYFDHSSETPGLGGEIKTEKFQSQFAGKHILDAEGQFVGLAILKAGQSAEGQDAVDAISGATITSKGVQTMILTSIQAYAAAGWFGQAEVAVEEELEWHQAEKVEEEVIENVEPELTEE
ncbi:MAG: NADH:ubiquinone reductase (Na(+)-transporting) subunit C [Paludibacteraceae bacterium]|nr:NADH:ubiquinone reductase (Na(+)-transporting) subunit C [Paludibacteraceae bacterium]